MVSFRLNHWFNAPIEAVFERFSNVDALPTHVAAIREVSLLTEGPVGAGTRFRVIGRKGRRVWEMTEFVHNRSLTIRSQCYFNEVVLTFIFLPNLATTNLKMLARCRASGFFSAFFYPFAAANMLLMKVYWRSHIQQLSQSLSRRPKSLRAP